jgi:hypothetical protein
MGASAPINTCANGGVMKILIWVGLFLAVGFSVWALHKIFIAGFTLFFPPETTHE